MQNLLPKNNTVVSGVSYASAMEEKFRMVQLMLERNYYYKEVAYLVELPLELIESIQEKRRDCAKLIETARQTSHAVFFGSKIVQVFSDLFQDPTELEEKIRDFYEEIVQSSKRSVKLRVAYRIIELRDRIWIDTITAVTGLEARQVECLIEVARIRIGERKRTSKKIAERLLEAGLEAKKICQLTNLSLERLQTLQYKDASPLWEEDEELYSFDYCFLK